MKEELKIKLNILERALKCTGIPYPEIQWDMIDEEDLPEANLALEVIRREELFFSEINRERNIEPVYYMDMAKLYNEIVKYLLTYHHYIDTDFGYFTIRNFVKVISICLQGLHDIKASTIYIRMRLQELLSAGYDREELYPSDELIKVCEIICKVFWLEKNKGTMTNCEMINAILDDLNMVI